MSRGALPLLGAAPLMTPTRATSEGQHLVARAGRRASWFAALHRTLRR